LPGIVFIAGERIEYFVKEGNTLRQLRRGTLGTGVKNVYEVGTNVYDQNISKTVPYKDRTLVEHFNPYADGLTNTFEIGFPVDSVDEIEVFVEGRRIRKSAIEVFNPTIALDSPEGDTTSIEEFTLVIIKDEFGKTISSTVVLNTAPLAADPTIKVRVTVIKKVGQAWTLEGTNLGDSENSIARFLRAGTSALPE